MKHWDRKDGGEVVKLKVRGRDRRAFYHRLGVETERESLSGTSVALVLGVAVCAGLAWGLSTSRPAASGPDKPILWGETQSVPQAAADASDAEWAARAAGQENAPRLARDERAGSGAATRSFSFCHSGGGTNCVVDGDTFYLDGQKIRIADIDAPETHDYGCASELARGERATRRLQGLLNSGSVRLASIDRDADAYGRKLRIVEVDGAGVGETLVDEGLARWYAGGRRSWC